MAARDPLLVDEQGAFRKPADRDGTIRQFDPLLDASEMLLIGSHTTQKQLALVLFSIAEQRDNLALKASKQFAVMVFLASLIYSGVAVLFTLWVVYLQNSQMMSNLKVLG